MAREQQTAWRVEVETDWEGEVLMLHDFLVEQVAEFAKTHECNLPRVRIRNPQGTPVLREAMDERTESLSIQEPGKVIA